MAESKASGNCIKNTVAALMSKGSTISAAEISQDVRKQREKEMNVLLNRFQQPVDVAVVVEPEAEPMKREKARHIQAAIVSSTPPPAPPPMPPVGYLNSPSSSAATGSGRRHVEAKCVIKRKSGGKDEPKRKKIATTTATTTTTARLYPTLSDIESTSAVDSDVDNYTTATMSSDNEEPQHQQQRFQPYTENSSEEDDEQDERYL